MTVSEPPASADAVAPRRALIFAGGGMKVAFQAGVLQVLLDEARLDGRPLDFDIADGCSGGVFNLAMWCEGRSGKQIADAWRNFPVRKGIGLNWKQYWKLVRARSLLSMGRFRRNILRAHWELDWPAIQAMRGHPRAIATFNAYNFTRQRLETRRAADVDEDFLVAGVALPSWFPPVQIGTDTYIDPVFVTDANVEAAIDEGATELWVIWTVSTRGEWQNGPTGNYFGIIETAANGQFERARERIEKNNADFAAGRHSQYGRHIDLKIIRGEVPLHYLLNLRTDRFRQAVELGVGMAREWCLKQPGMTLQQIPYTPGAVTSLNFHERMEGYMASGTTDFEQGHEAGRAANGAVVQQLKIEVRDVDEFISDPDHDAVITGELEGDPLGGKVTVTGGRFNLMPFQGHFDERWMFYWLPFTDAHGQDLVLYGYKRLVDDPGGDLWKDSTTLHVHLLEGAPRQPPPVADLIRNARAGRPPAGQVRAAGILTIDVADFLKLLATMHADGASRRAEFSAMMRFSAFFMGGLWDAYAKRVLSASPF